MEIKKPYEITAEDILKAQRMHDETTFYHGLMNSDIVLDLIISKFDFKDSTHFYKLDNGKMGYYVDKDEWVTVYEVRNNNFWVKRLSKDNFLAMYGEYISMAEPESPEEAEIDENDTLLQAIEEAKNDVR